MSPRHRRRQQWRLGIAGAAAVAAAVALSPAASSATTAPTPDDLRTACAHRQNNTPKKLVDCVNRDDLWAHMVKFQQIADANPGADGHPSRNSGEPGYKASADYVASVMRAAGYDVTLQEYKFHYTSFVGDPVLREDSPTPHSFGLGTDFNPAQVAGSTSAKLQPVGGIVVPATPTPSSASGCSASDFADVRAGQHRLDTAGHVRPSPRRWRMPRPPVLRRPSSSTRATQDGPTSSPGACQAMSRSLSSSRPTPSGTQLLGAVRPGLGPGSDHRCQDHRRPEPIRLECHRRLQGRRPEQHPRHRRPPGRHLRSRDARQRVGLGHDP